LLAKTDSFFEKSTDFDNACLLAYLETTTSRAVEEVRFKMLKFLLEAFLRLPPTFIKVSVEL